MSDLQTTQEQERDSQTAQTPSLPVRDKRVQPEGVVPKQAQGYVVAGVAVLILIAVMFSKSHTKPPAKDATRVPLAVSTDLNQRKIQELEQELSADQRQIEKQAAAQRTSTMPSSAGSATAMNSSQSGVASSPPSPASAAQPTEPLHDPIADAEKAIAFKARFASNLVSARVNASRQSLDSVDLSANAESRSTSMLQAPAPQAEPGAPALVNKRHPEVNVNAAQGQPYVVFEGTTIDTVLVNRLDGEFAGPVKVMVTNAVYSQDRQHVLIPGGTFILGDVEKVAGFGQKRLAVTFHRMLMPDGYSVDLDRFRALDQAGATGLKDRVNTHYVEIFGASIALGVIAGAAEASNLNQGYNESGTEAYKAGVASSLSQSSANVLDRFINIPPTITIREGHRIKVYLTQDMLLPAYENHDIPSTM